MAEIIKFRSESCIGCNRCVRECPMETANITYLDEAGNTKVRIDFDKCVNCGRCVFTCKHDARYYEDDAERFFVDLEQGVPISVITAPSIRTNIPEYRRLFTYLKQRGANLIFDVSLGADICIWAHIRSLEKRGFTPMITQPCPVVVKYCETYRHDLLKRLSPVHSPMACASIFLKKYMGVGDRIAAISPCIAKASEFMDTELADYNITFMKLLAFLKARGTVLPEQETDFDNVESGLGSLFPMPGGLKENLEYYLGRRLHISTAEGMGIFEKLNKYAHTPEDFLPDVFSVLNCAEGCNVGPASLHERSIFHIEKTMDDTRRRVSDARTRERYDDAYKAYDEKYDLSHFVREYHPKYTAFPQITCEDIDKAFELMGKTDRKKQNLDCGACGSKTCRDMARKVALTVSIPYNCMVKAMDDARAEHENNEIALEQIAKMEKMREADELTRIMLDANPLVSHFWDEDYNIVDCNEASVKMFGLSSKKEYMERFFELTPQYQPDGANSQDKFRRLIDKTFEDGFQKTEWMRQSPFGEMIPVELTLVRVDYKGTNLVAGYCRDLREHTRMMREIESSAKELAAALEKDELRLMKLNLTVQAAKIGLWDMEIISDDPMNPSSPFTWSDEFRSMLGYTDENDFPNKLGSWSDRIHPDDRAEVLALFEKHLLDKTGKSPFDVEYRMFRKDGECAYVRDFGETIRDKHGRPIRAAGALRDVTETKNLINEAEKQRVAAEEANRAKSAFLSTMSHEIRTPMNAILGIAEIQLQKEELDAGAREAIEKIYFSGDLLLGIINDILDLSKIEAGKLDLVVGSYDVASLLSDTAYLNMMWIGSKQIEFELVVDENVPATLLGDELRVKQILNNLLSNAFKYTEEGTVKLTASSEAGGGDGEVTLVLCVSDTGPGMTKEQVAKLFDEYERFNHKINRATKGTGLGMSITRNLLRLMRGDISVVSKPGAGSAFTVRLPQGASGTSVLGKAVAENLRKFHTRSRAHMKSAQVTREPMPYGSVLVVDDVETNIYVAKGLLAPYELAVDSAGSGLAAIKKIKKGNVYDVIFMDHMMPHMDGIEVTKCIRATGYDRPIVALTANAVSGQSEIFLKSGFDDFLSKPIDIRHLNVVLNRYVRDKHPDEAASAAASAAKQRGKPGAGQAPEKKAAARALDAQTAQAFIRDAKKVLKALGAFMAKGSSHSESEIKTYVIHVHGIKSALANVGNLELSSVARRLEQLGRAGDTGRILSETPAFVSSLKAYVKEIAPRRGGGGDAAVSEEDILFLREKLLAIKAAGEEYDTDVAEAALEDLRSFSWPRRTDALLDSLSEMLLHSDFDIIAEAVDKFEYAKDGA